MTLEKKAGRVALLYLAAVRDEQYRGDSTEARRAAAAALEDLLDSAPSYVAALHAQAWAAGLLTMSMLGQLTPSQHDLDDMIRGVIDTALPECD